tara:strand:- start:56 stop:655 length:600 start_codon:yes stop_codon:yes gene_type:complete
MAQPKSRYNHRRFYQKSERRKIIPKFEITAGMIITFKYDKGRDTRPLVFVMDTDEYVKAEKRRFSGINLNYMPIGELNQLFIKILAKTGWEYSKITKMPKVDIWDEENPGMRPEIIYNQIIKKQVLNKRDCWRTYKYIKCNMIEQVNFQFNIPPLDNLIEKLEVGKITKDAVQQSLTETRYGRIAGDTTKDEKKDENKS